MLRAATMVLVTKCIDSGWMVLELATLGLYYRLQGSRQRADGQSRPVAHQRLNNSPGQVGHIHVHIHIQVGGMYLIIGRSSEL